MAAALGEGHFVNMLGIEPVKKILKDLILAKNYDNTSIEAIQAPLTPDLLQSENVPPHPESFMSSVSRKTIGDRKKKRQNTSKSSNTSWTRESVSIEVENKVDHSSKFTDLGLDSLAGFEFVATLQTTFGVKLSANTFLLYPTIESLVDYIFDVVSESPSVQDINKVPIDNGNHSHLMESRVNQNEFMNILGTSNNGPDASSSLNKICENIIFVLCTPRSGSTLLQLHLRT